MSTKIKILENDNNVVVDIYVNNKWFKQVIPEINIENANIVEVLNCVSHSLMNDPDYTLINRS